jgi:hypothetical protein
MEDKTPLLHFSIFSDYPKSKGWTHGLWPRLQVQLIVFRPSRSSFLTLITVVRCSKLRGTL